MTSVPPSMLVDFFIRSRAAMMDCRSTTFLTIAECRQQLLKEQLLCLEDAVNKYNSTLNDPTQHLTLEKVQEELKSFDTPSEEMEAMNDAARSSLARMVLQAQSRRDAPVAASTPTTMTRSDLLDFCSLVHAAMGVEEVQQYVKGSVDSLFGDQEEAPPGTSSSSLSPRDRIEYVKKLFWQALGYHDSEWSAKELSRILQEQQAQNDTELLTLFFQTFSNIMDIISEIEGQQNGTPFGHGDANNGSNKTNLQDDGVTRVVSVQYSESVLTNAETGNSQQQQQQESSSSGIRMLGVAPNQQPSIHEDDDQQEVVAAHKQTAALRESLLQELLQMEEGDRVIELKRAEEAVISFQQRILQVQPGVERIAILQDMDADTRRLLALHSTWQTYSIRQQT